MLTQDTNPKEDKSVIRELPDGGAEFIDRATPSTGAESLSSEDAHKADTAEEDSASVKRGDAATEAEELAGARTDEEREAIRVRRRQERRDKRDNRRQREDTMRHELSLRDRELAELRQAVATMQQRSAGTELAQLDNEMHQALSVTEELKSIIARAAAEQNGQIVADATDRLVKINQRQADLQRIRASFINSQAREAAQVTHQHSAPQLDRRVIEHGRRWAGENAWYDPQGDDLDSRIVKQIDDAVMKEGFDPRSPDYWDELSSRVTQYLPHRVVNRSADESEYDSATITRRPVRSAVSGPGRDSAAAGGKKNGSYTLSAERVKALKDAGVWDDPEKRADALRRYRDYDRDASNR